MAKKYPVYPQGTILFVDFGKNVGNEFNYKHFAIVINSNDSENNSTINVLPLTSKNKYKKNVPLNFSVIHELILNHMDNKLENLKIMDAFMMQEKMVRETYGYGDLYVQTYSPLLINYVSSKNSLQMIVENDDVRRWIEEDKLALEAISKKYEKYNKQSYAKIESIKEIDKSRIVEKINHFDPINTTILPDKELKLLKKALRKHFNL